MLEVDSKRNEMETGDENGNITEREMVDQSCELRNGNQNSAQNTGPRGLLADQEKDGKTKSTNSSNNLKTRLKIRLKVAARTRRIGSTQQKDRGRWTPLEEYNTKNSVTRTIRNSHNRSASRVNGVKMNDEEIADTCVPCSIHVSLFLLVLHCSWWCARVVRSLVGLYNTLLGARPPVVTVVKLLRN